LYSGSAPGLISQGTLPPSGIAAAALTVLTRSTEFVINNEKKIRKIILIRALDINLLYTMSRFGGGIG